MRRPLPPRLARASALGYRLWVRLCPAAFRREFGEAMRRDFEELCETAWRERGIVGLARLWVEAAIDAARTAVRERRPEWLHLPERAARTHTMRDPGGRRMHSIALDLRHAARALSNQPGYASVIVLTVGLGIGANTALFSLIDSVLLRPLPFTRPERLVAVWETVPDETGAERARFRVTAANFLDWREQNDVFEEMALFGAASRNLTGEGEPEQLFGALVDEGYFRALGVEPVLGRVFHPDENRPGGERVVILGYELWKGRFGGRSDIVGAKITLDENPHVVVGVLPPGIYPTWPRTSASLTFLPSYQQFWVPLALSEEIRANRMSHVFGAIARLEQGIGLAEAQAQMDVVARRLERAHPRWNEGEGILLRPLEEEVVGEVRPALLVLFGAVGLVLLISCANLAHLQLARSPRREKEAAVRAAMGASRGRLVRTFLVESLLLGLAGGLVGAIVAGWGLQLLLAIIPQEIPRITEARLHGAALVFNFALALITGVLFGVLPAVRLSRTDLRSGLRGRGAGTMTGRPLGRSLVATEITIAVVLVVGASLLVRTFWALRNIDPGFRADNVLTAELQLPAARYGDWRQITLFHEQLLDEIGRIPDVISAALAYDHPLEATWIDGFRVEGRTEPAEPSSGRFRPVSAEYFRTVGIELERGRAFTELDDADHPGVVIINEALARRHFPGANPLGKRLEIERPSALWEGAMPRSFEIVGVVGNVRFLGLREEADPAFYVPALQMPLNDMSLLVKTSEDPLRLVPRIRERLRALDPNLPITRLGTLEELLDRALAPARFQMLLLGAFGLSALVLAGIGVYGLVSHGVSERTHEMGIRVALGAQANDILRLVMGDGMRPVALGLAFGIAAALGLVRLLSGLLFGIQPTDPATFAGVAVFLSGVALLASYLPARRAARADPVAALRCE